MRTATAWDIWRQMCHGDVIEGLDRLATLDDTELQAFVDFMQASPEVDQLDASDDRMQAMEWAGVICAREEQERRRST